MSKAWISAAFGLLGVLVAPTAQAATLGTENGLTYVKKSATLSPEIEPEAADATAKCPGATVGTGGGVSVSGDASAAFIASTGSTASDEWFGESWHDGGAAQAKTTTWAICSKKAAKIASETHSDNTGPGPTPGNVIAECSQGHVVGGGVRLDGPATDWWIDFSFPIDTPADGNSVPDNGWRTFVFRRPSPIGGTMRADAVCMKGKAPAYRYKEVSTSDDVVELGVKCPRTSSVTGGGSYASSLSDDVRLVASRPTDGEADRGTVPDDGWEITLYNDGGVNQTFIVYAICR